MRRWREGKPLAEADTDSCVGPDPKFVEQPSALSQISTHPGHVLPGLPGIHENNIFD